MFANSPSWGTGSGINMNFRTHEIKKAKKVRVIKTGLTKEQERKLKEAKEKQTYPPDRDEFYGIGD